MLRRVALHHTSSVMLTQTHSAFLPQIKNSIKGFKTNCLSLVLLCVFSYVTHLTLIVCVRKEELVVNHTDGGEWEPQEGLEGLWEKTKRESISCGCAIYVHVCCLFKRILRIDLCTFLTMLSGLNVAETICICQKSIVNFLIVDLCFASSTAHFLYLYISYSEFMILLSCSRCDCKVSCGLAEYHNIVGH